MDSEGGYTDYGVQVQHPLRKNAAACKGPLPMPIPGLFQVVDGFEVLGHLTGSCGEEAKGLRDLGAHQPCQQVA